MEEELPTGAEGTDGSEPAPSPPVPSLPPELSTAEAEVRRLVEAGAGSPEELRALAARLQEQRSLEQSMWRQAVRPALMDSKKLRFSLSDLRKARDGSGASSAPIAVVSFFAVVVLLLIATQTSFLWMLLPVLGVLGYAYAQGRAEHAPPEGSAADPPPEDGTD